MIKFPSKVYGGISLKTWIVLIGLYLFPPLFNYFDLDDQYFHNVLWFYYLIPTLLIVYNKGIEYGGLAIVASSLFFLSDESFQENGITKHEMILLFEMITINLLVSIIIGILVKRNRQKQKELNHTNNLLESIFHNLDIGVWSITKRKSLLLSKGIEKIYGLSREKELRNNQFWRKSIHPDDLSIADEIDNKWENSEGYQYEYRILRPNGEVRWILDQGLPVFNESGEHERYDGTNVDITRQKELEFHLKESEERYKSLVEKALVGVFMIQNHKLVYVNQWITEFLGLTEKELLGTSLLNYMKVADRNRIVNHFQKLIVGQESFFIDEIQITDQGEATKYLEIQATLSSINGSLAIIGIALDVTEKKKTKDELEYLAYHDSLTGLPNKHYINKEITKDFNLSKSLGIPVCIMCLNLDRFKLINDSFGHQVGDQLVKMVSKRIIESIKLRPNGKAIRAEGDEFIIYLLDSNEMQAQDFARNLLEVISEPFCLVNQEIRIAASIGIAKFERDDSLEEVVQKASSALHFAKEFGGHQYQLYSSQFGKQANRRLQLEQRLRKAMEEKNLEVVYQPKLDLFTNSISGMEALIRWNDPILGEVSPAEFIPIAEETGIIISIGKWVLETACKQNREWDRNGYPKIHVCVNISSKQFLQDDFVKMIKHVLNEADLSPEYLNLEITERIALYDIDDAIGKLQQLKQLGVSISLDDFGTGYSSLSYLKLLPIDFLKIDRSFISGIFENKQDVAIIDSIISLTHSLGMRVVAEGVEDEQQLNILSEMRCDEIQGFYYAKPMTAKDINIFLDKKGEFHLVDRG